MLCWRWLLRQLSGHSRSSREIRFRMRDRDKKSSRNFDSLFASEGIRIPKDAGVSADGKRNR
jgi:hypothetical protein